MFNYYFAGCAVCFRATETRSWLGKSEVFNVHSLGLVLGTGGSLEGRTGTDGIQWADSVVCTDSESGVRGGGETVRAKEVECGRGGSFGESGRNEVDSVHVEASWRFLYVPFQVHEIQYRGCYPVQTGRDEGIVGCLSAAGSEVRGVLFFDRLELPGQRDLSS